MDSHQFLLWSAASRPFSHQYGAGIHSSYPQGKFLSFKWVFERTMTSQNWPGRFCRESLTFCVESIVLTLLKELWRAKALKLSQREIFQSGLRRMWSVFTENIEEDFFTRVWFITWAPAPFLPLFWKDPKQSPLGENLLGLHIWRMLEKRRVVCAVSSPFQIQKTRSMVQIPFLMQKMKLFNSSQTSILRPFSSLHPQRRQVHYSLSKILPLVLHLGLIAHSTNYVVLNESYLCFEG